MLGNMGIRDKESVQAQLDKLLASPQFIQSDRLVRFLQYIVDKELAEHGSKVNQYSLAIDLYGRDNSFDPAVDSVVRVDAARLRTKLREYYDSLDQKPLVRFELPKGSYGVKINIESNDISSTVIPGAEGSQKSTDTQSTDYLPFKFPMVVLPLDVISNKKEDQELADGITDQIISNLGKSNSISVVSRRSAFAYKGKVIDARQIAKELEVNYILEGTLRRSGNRVRVSVAAIDSLNGQQIWTETFQKEVDDEFELQDDIATSIGSALDGVLWGAATAGANRTPPEHLNAAGLVHRAADQILNYSRRMFDESEKLVIRALELDPELGHAYALVAFSSSHRVLNHWTNEPEKLRQESLEAAERALELAPNDSWVLSWTADALTWMGEHQRAISLMEHALRLEPDSILNQLFMGNVLIHAGRNDEGLNIVESALSKSPNYHYVAPASCFLGHAYSGKGDFKKAELAVRRGVEIMTGNPIGWLIYANALALNEKTMDAQHAVSEILRLCPGITVEYIEWIHKFAFASKKQSDNLLKGLKTLEWS